MAVRWYLGSGSRIAPSRSCSPSGGRGRPCHLVPVGAALHSAPRRRRPAPSPRGRRPLVRRRDLREARRTWRYVNRAIDQHGQIVDVYGSARRDTLAARRSFTTVLGSHGTPGEVVTDRAWTMLAVVDELMPTVFTTPSSTRTIGSRRSRPAQSRLRPMRGRKRDGNARVIIRGHAFMQNLRRGHYELGAGARTHRRVAAFTELAATPSRERGRQRGARHVWLNATEPHEACSV